MVVIAKTTRRAGVNGEGIEDQNLENQIVNHHFDKDEVKGTVSGHQENLISLLRRIWSCGVTKRDLHGRGVIFAAWTHWNVFTIG